MNTPLQCDIHGEDVATIVCMHILDTLDDEKPRGFMWSIDEDGEYQAVCNSCRSMDDDSWANAAEEVGRVLCYSCFKRAAQLNGISSSELTVTRQ